MRSPEEVAREVVQAKTGLAIDRILTEWQAEVAEQVRAEVLAGFTEHFAAAFMAAGGRVAIMGHQVLDREYATRQAEDMSSPEDATPSFVARRLVGPWEPVES